MDVLPLRQAEQIREQARDQHADGEEVSQVHSFSDEATVNESNWFTSNDTVNDRLPEEHAGGVREQERAVERSEEGLRVLPICNTKKRTDEDPAESSSSRGG